MQRKDENFLENFSAILDLVPREMNVLEKMDLFTTEMASSDYATFEFNIAGTDDMYSVARGADRQVAGDDTAINAVIEIPYFTLDKSAKPSEVQNLREFATSATPETVASKVRGHIQRINRSHAKLLKKVMYSALKGSTYAIGKDGQPRTNLTKTYQSMFDISDADMFNGAAGGVKAYNLADQGSDPMVEFETFRDHVIAKAQDGVVGGDNYELVMIMGNGAFQALKSNVFVKEGFTNFTDGVSLRARLGGLANNPMFEFDGIVFMSDQSGEIPTDEGYIFPKGLVEFTLVHGCADAVGYENQEAEESYLFINEGTRKVTVESETAVVASVNRCDLIGHYEFTIA